MVRNSLREWGPTLDEMNEIIVENPPVLSTFFRFVAEYKLNGVARFWEMPERGHLARTDAAETAALQDPASPFREALSA